MHGCERVGNRPQVETMRFNWKWGIPAAVVGMVVLAWFAIDKYVGYPLRTLDFSAPSPQVQGLKKQLQWAVEEARKGSFPSRRVDHTSVGSALTEAKLLEIRRDTRAYESMLQRLPIDFSELESVGLPPNWKENLEKLRKDCRIVVLTSDSEILNCDGWTRPSASDLDALLRSFDPRTERFYKVESHVLLYVPPLTKGIPTPIKMKD
jgi:hypothetical protein